MITGPRLIPDTPSVGRADHALGASTLLHAAVLGTLLLIIGVIVPATPPEPPTVQMLFEPAAAPAPTPAAAPATPPPRQQTAPPPPQPEPPPPQPAPPQPEPPPPVAMQPPPPSPPPPTDQPPPPSEAVEQPLPLPPPPPPVPPRQPAHLRPESRPQSVERAAPPPPEPSPAPAASAPAPAEAPTAQPAPPVTSAWKQELAAWLASHRIYPQEARRRGEQGSVTIRFTVAPSGRVTNVEVVRGSGSPRLDAAAEAMLRNAMVPPFDPAMRQAPRTETVQIRYMLED